MPALPATRGETVEIARRSVHASGEVSTRDMISTDGTPELVFYGVFSREAGRVIEFFGTPESAERMRARVLRDEPDWETDLAIARVDFGRVGAVEVMADSAVREDTPDTSA